VSLRDGMRQVHEVTLAEGRIPPSEAGGWEDQIVERVQRLRAAD